MKPNNASPGTFSCLKFGRVTPLKRIAHLSILIRALYIYSVIKMICSYKRDNTIMSTLHCNFLWAVRKQRQSDSLWKKISLEDIHCLTEKSLYNIPVKAPSQLIEELNGHLSTKKLSSSQLIWELWCSNSFGSSSMEHKVSLILNHNMELTIKLALINGMIWRSAFNWPSSCLLGVNIMPSAYTLHNPEQELYLTTHFSPGKMPSLSQGAQCQQIHSHADYLHCSGGTESNTRSPPYPASACSGSRWNKTRFNPVRITVQLVKLDKSTLSIPSGIVA